MSNNSVQDRSNLAALIRKLAALGDLVFNLVTSVRSEIAALRSQISWNSFSVSNVSESVTQVKSEVSGLRSQISFNTNSDKARDERITSLSSQVSSIQSQVTMNAVDDLQIYLASKTFGRH